MIKTEVFMIESEGALGRDFTQRVSKDLCARMDKVCKSYDLPRAFFVTEAITRLVEEFEEKKAERKKEVTGAKKGNRLSF